MGAAEPRPDVPLNLPIGPHRRLRVGALDLTDFKIVKDAFGGTVNDVVLAVMPARCAPGCTTAACAPRVSN